MVIYKLRLPLLSPRGLEMINSMGGGGGMVDAPMYPASRIAVKPTICEYTSIVGNMLLL